MLFHQAVSYSGCCVTFCLSMDRKNHQVKVLRVHEVMLKILPIIVTSFYNEPLVTLHFTTNSMTTRPQAPS